MKFIHRIISELFTTDEILSQSKNIHSLTKPQIIGQFFVSHHRDSVHIALSDKRSR